MADYSYTTGQGLTALSGTTPNGAIEPVSILDDAIRQIKLYLLDSTVGPAALIASLLPTGTTFLFCSNTIPTGFLKCDGSAVSRTTYSALFAIISTTFGSGNGSTTFNLPDFRGRCPTGAGTGDASDATAWTLAAKRGTESNTLTAGQLPAHTHEIVQYGGNGISSGGTNSSPPQNSAGLNPTSYTGYQTGSIGSNTAVGNIQPSLAINFIIKF